MEIEIDPFSAPLAAAVFKFLGLLYTGVSI
jgi:hypothetical protein